MRKILAICAIVCTLSAAAQTVSTTTTITWPLNLGTEGQVATYSDGTGDYFKPDHIALGDNLSYTGSRESNGVTFTKFNPTAQTGAGPENVISFNIWPVAGLTFVPTSIAFDCQRYGTDSGLIDVVWKSSDGTSTTLETGLKPARDNTGEYTHASYDLSALAIPASDGEGSLEIYLYDLGDTKEVGIANVEVIGTVEGTVQNVTTYTLSTSVSPAEAGSIEASPVGDVHDEGTEITLTAVKHFGYNFSHWADENDQEVSAANPYTFTLNSDVTLKAVFTAVNTYSLNVNVQGGAADYMVTAMPAGTTVADQLVYEEGTNVTLTAASNPVLTFTNWGSGETTADLELVMNENKDITAVYSAVDFIVGWDFHLLGNAGRAADFFSKPDNESAALVLKKEDGTTSSWLDKSQVAANGYEGQPAAVNWNNLADNYYYQINFDASDFTNIEVAADMLFNYNAYSVQKVEYSLDGTNFTEIGTYTLVDAKVWYSQTFGLPEAANNAAKVYIRWYPDYTSEVVGAASEKDGTAISAIYVTGTEEIVDDGTAPVLTSSVPAANGTGASATGKVVLNFDEKVQIADNTTADLGGEALAPIVSGKTISFAYTGLDYNTGYTFTLNSGVVSDLSGNTLTETISFSFTTLDKPVVSKKMYDFIVGVDGDFAAALDAADKASDSGERFFIFFPNGEYDLGTTTGDATQQTHIGIPNVSYIGESADGVILYNSPDPANEGIGTTPTINFLNTSNNIYMQDVTILNKMDYRTGSFQGRAVALRDQGDKNIYKNVKLLSNQDTYYSGKNRYYFENSEIHGTVDFIFGDGDVFFNECLIYLEDRSGNHVTAAATSSDWGYVFSNCTIDGYEVNNGSYKLGRPWQNAPKTVYINTTMKVLPSAEGWSEWGALPAVYAEYNSMTASGGTVDLSNRRTQYTNDVSSVTLDPSLTEEQAAAYTIENVLGGDDAWQPRLYTEQAHVPEVTSSGSSLSWEDSDYVLGWAVIKDGEFVEFVTTNSYTASSTGTYTVRAANAMGGLSAASNAVEVNEAKVATTITWEVPASITFGTALSSAQLNATADGNTSTPVYNPPAGTVLGVGTHELSVTFAADDNYEAAFKTVSIQVVEAPLGVENSVGLSIFPNPVSESIFVQVDASEESPKVVIMSFDGRVLIQKASNQPKVELDLSGLSAGTYLLKIQVGQDTVSRKIIKK